MFRPRVGRCVLACAAVGGSAALRMRHAPCGCGRAPCAGSALFLFLTLRKRNRGKKKNARGGQSIPLWTPPNASPAGVRRRQRLREPGSTHTFARRSRRTFFGSKDKMARQLRRAGSDGSVLCVQTIIGAASSPPHHRLSVVRSARSDEDRAFMIESGENERIGGVQRGGPPPLASFFSSHGRKRKGAPAE